MRKLGWFSMCFAAAAAVYVKWLSWRVGVALSLVCAAALAFALRRWGWRRRALILLGLCVGFLWTAGYDCLHVAPLARQEGTSATCIFLLRDELELSDYSVSALAETKLSGRRCQVLLYFRDQPDVRAGDRVEVDVRFVAQEAEDNELYYRANGVDLVAYARADATVLGPAPDGLRTATLRMRSALKQRIDTLFPSDTAAFVRALLTGDRSRLSYAQRNLLSVCGIAHTVAISGMHISILLGMITLLFGNRPHVTALLGLPVITLYTLVVGAPPSVVRAAVMQGFFLLAPLLDRTADGPTALGASALCVLLPDPWAVANLNFQLSFVSMAGILFCSGRIYRWLAAGRMPRHPLARLPVRYAFCTLSSSISAMLLTVPLIAAHFGVVSLSALATNLLTAWAVSAAFRLALAACALSFLWLWPAKLLAWAAAVLVRYLLAVAGAAAQVPFAAVYTENVYIVLWLGFVYLAGGACIALRGSRLSFACAAALTLCLCLWLGSYDRAAPFRFTMLDVGQGQCLVYQTGDVTLMYDCGGEAGEAVGEQAARFLLAQSCTRLDLLVLSHYDADHASGVCQLLGRVRVGRLYLPDVPCESGLRDAIEQAARERGTELRYVTGEEILNFSGAEVHIYPPVSKETENSASLAMRYSLGAYDILTTGDLPAAGERQWLNAYPLSGVEVLVAGHHGSADSNSGELLHAARPEAVLISVGSGNPYGHPSPELLERLARDGIAVYRTDLCGNITIRR